jgi:hypothetical protein
VQARRIVIDLGVYLIGVAMLLGFVLMLARVERSTTELNMSRTTLEQPAGASR